MRSRLLALASAALLACATGRSTATSTPPATPTSTSTSTSTPTPTSAATPSAIPEPNAPVAPTERTPAQLEQEKALAERAAAVYDAFVNRILGLAGQLTPDGTRVLFGSNRDGSPQIYLGEVARPSAPPVAVTKGPERVLWARLTRDGKALLFARDRGADENHHLYRVGLDGAGLVDLTPEEGVRHEPPALPLRRADLMVYATRTVKSPASTVVVQPVSGGPARKVYEDLAPTFVADAAPDGSRALLLRLISPSEAIVLELDLAKGTARRVWPAEGKKEAVGAAAYSADGKTIYVATDQGGEVSALLALDAGGKVRATWHPHPPTAIVDDLNASPRGDLLAVHVDAGNRSEVRILDARTLAEKVRPKAPLGTLLLGDFTPDGARLVVNVSTPDRPPEPLAVDARTGALAPLRDDARPGLAALARIETSLASVAAFDGKPIPVNVALPAERPAGKRLPVIVSFHGGPSASSSFGWNPTAQFFAGLGYAWIEPNVRGSTGFGRAWEMADNRDKRGDVLKDMESVNRWVKAQPWADPDRVVVYGGSYGGWVVLMALTRQPQLWSAGVDLVGVADLRTLLRGTDQLIRAIFVDEFGDLGKDDALLAAWSPLPDAAKITAPLFVYQGQNDPRVLRSQSDDIVRAVRAKGLPVEYMVAPDEGHSLARRANVIEFLSRSARFLDEHLAKPGAAPAG